MRKKNGSKLTLARETVVRLTSQQLARVGGQLDSGDGDGEETISLTTAINTPWCTITSCRCG